MTDFSFKYSGFRETIAVIHQLTDLGKVADRGMYKWAHEQVATLRGKQYPAPRGRYDRTYRLQRGFYTYKEGDSAYGFDNVEPYSRYVVSRKNQAWMHKDIWWTIEDVLEEALPKADDYVFEAIHTVWVSESWLRSR